MITTILDNKYIISSNGRVTSLKTQKELKYYIHKTKGYRFIAINGKTILLHRLIATTFIANPNNYPEVNHKDGDKSNNCMSNLEWCTPKQNTQHAINHGLRKTPIGKHVINTVTKEVYPSIIKAWESSNKEFSYTHLKAMLQGIFPNKTIFKYYEVVA